MTGVFSKENNFIIDLPEERYEKYRKTSQKFRIIQLGITPFKCVGNNSFQCTPFTIYVFPENDSEEEIGCELKSIIFNRDNGKIDFNKWIYKGVNYLNDKKYSKIYQSIVEENINLYDPDKEEQYINSVPSKESDIQICEGTIKEILEFFNNKDVPDLLIEKIPRFMLIYIKNKLPTNIRKEIFIKEIILRNGKHCLIINKVKNEEHRKQLLQEDIAKKLEHLEKRKKVKRIYDALLRKKSVVVGHNFILDLLFLISHFGKPLPDYYLQFKVMVREMFSGVYDTKIIFESLQKKTGIKAFRETNSVLEKMLPLLKEKAKEEINIEILPKKNIDINNFHNAGFDSYVTGIVFIYMRKYYIHDNYESIFKNKIFMMKSLYRCFDIDGVESYMFGRDEAICLKANKNNKTADIDLIKIIGVNLYYKVVKKVVTMEEYNSILLLAEMTESEKARILCLFNKKNYLFTWSNLDDFRSYIKKNYPIKNLI